MTNHTDTENKPEEVLTLPVFTDAKRVSKHGRGFLRPIVFQLAICAALGGAGAAAYFFAPEIYEYFIGALLSAVGKC